MDQQVHKVRQEPHQQDHKGLKDQVEDKVLQALQDHKVLKDL
jgi:hypothetical protein